MESNKTNKRAFERERVFIFKLVEIVEVSIGQNVIDLKTIEVLGLFSKTKLFSENANHSVNVCMLIFQCGANTRPIELRLSERYSRSSNN